MLWEAPAEEICIPRMLYLISCSDPCFGLLPRPSRNRAVSKYLNTSDEHGSRSVVAARISLFSTDTRRQLSALPAHLASGWKGKQCPEHQKPMCGAIGEATI